MNNVDLYISQNNISFEGERAVRNLEKLCKKLDYDSLEHFLSDNPGAIELLYEFIGENFDDKVSEFIDDDDDDDEGEDED